MYHPVLGKLGFDADNKRWRAFYPFENLLPLGLPWETEEAVADEEMQELTGNAEAAIEAMKEKIREKFGEEADAVFAALEAEIQGADVPGGETVEETEDDEEEPVESAESKAEYARDEARWKQEERKKLRGLFPIVFESNSEKVKPSEKQRAALKHLLANEGRIAASVTEALFRSYQEYYADENWRSLCDLPEIKKAKDVIPLCSLVRVAVMREHINGISYLVFPVDCAWEQEHGMFVVYHPDMGADWATGDNLYDLLECDEFFDEEQEVPGNQELVEAVLAKDEERVRDLIAQGHDINAVAEESPFPPLCAAVDQLDVDLVRRLLEIGADPRLRDFEGKTALGRARQMLKQMTPKKGDKLMEAALAMARKANPDAFNEMNTKLAEIIRLLEAAEK